jgi:hypothetical protein
VETKLCSLKCVTIKESPGMCPGRYRLFWKEGFDYGLLLSELMVEDIV